MATSADVRHLDSAHDGHDHVPPARPPRPWAWRASGMALVVGGLLTAAGGALRWWGPYRLADLAARENDDANPLHAGWSDHVHPGSGELVSSGQILVALGILLLLFLPWRGLAARLLAVVALSAGVASVGVRPAIWLSWWAQGRPNADFPGWSPPVSDAVMAPVVYLGSLWSVGLAQLVLACAALLTLGRTSSERPWRRTLSACVALLLTSGLVEYLIGFVLFLSDSHDDPVGTHVISGLGAVLTGVLLLMAPQPGGARSRGGLAPTRPSRLWWWIAAGALLASVGAVAVVRTMLIPPAEMMMTESGPPPVWRTIGLVTSALEVLAYAALAAGPWSGWRRIWITVLCLLAVLPTAMWLVLPEPGAEAPPPAWTNSLQVLASLTSTGLLFPLIALILVWEQGHRRALTGRSVTLVVLVTVLTTIAGRVLAAAVSAGEQPDIDTMMMAESLLPAAYAVIFGLTWLAAAAASRRVQRDDMRPADTDLAPPA